METGHISSVLGIVDFLFLILLLIFSLGPIELGDG